MSNFINKIKNINNESEKIKCESDNNNLDLSNNKKDEKKNIITTEPFNYSPEITFTKTPLI